MIDLPKYAVSNKKDTIEVLATSVHCKEADKKLELI